MADKFYGVWFPGEGWWRITRLADQKVVPWASTEYRFARAKAKELGGVARRIDEALGEYDAQKRMLAAEEAAKGKRTLWRIISSKLIRLFHLATLINS